MITFNTLDEALLAGVRVSHVDGNGDYVEYITFEDGKYFIRQWRYGSCVSVKTLKSIKEILRYEHKCYEIFNEGMIKKQYSLDEIREELKKVVDIQPEDNSYYMLFVKEIDGNTDFHLTIYKYSNYSYKYIIKVSKIRSFLAGQHVFERYAVDDEYYLQQCDVLIKTLEDLNLQNDWYREFKVKIKRG